MNHNFIFKVLLSGLFVFFSLTINAQCPTTAPTATNGCNMQTSSVALGASGSSGYYRWYDASSGGNFLASGSIYNTPVISATTDYYVAAAEENYALDFDGSNDYIQLGNPTALQITGDMTIEMWLYPTDFSERRNPYAKAYGGEGTITQETSGGLTYYYGTNGGNSSPYQGVSSNTALQLNTWTHITVVRDLTAMKISWYINGVLDVQTDASYSAATAGSNNAMIAAGYVQNYMGKIDEVRIWNTARTQAQIQDNMNVCLAGNESGLVAYYKFNDGPNSSVLSDLTSNNIDGTLTNMDNANDWVSSSIDYHCPTCESSRTTVTATIDNSAVPNLGNDASLGCTTTSISLDPGSGYSSYLWNTGASSQTISVSSEGKYSVKVENGSGCIGKDTVFIDQAGGSENDLSFDGTDDYVELGNPDKLKLTGNQTLEMWLYPTDFSNRVNPIAKAYGGEGAITQETDGTLNYYYGTSGQNSGDHQGINNGFALALNKWTHIAIVRDLTNMKLNWYINGVLTNQVDATYSSATSGTNLWNIGKGYAGNYKGQIDEVRIWNTARTQTQIRDNMCKKIYGTESGLVAYYRFDGSSGTVATDLSRSLIDGTIYNGATRTVSGAPIGDESSYIYTSNWSGVTLSHSTCAGESLEISNMSGNPNGVHIYSINAAPSTASGIQGLGINNRYFGVFKVNDDAASYTANYDYTNNPYVFYDGNLLLFKRTNNADANWTNTDASLDTTNNKLTTTASGTQFILGASSSSLPVELLSLSASIDKNIVDIRWSTASEINNNYFAIERSSDLKNWEEVTRVDGAGNSNTIINYSVIDPKPLQGISYYRLRQTDFNGQYSYSNTVSINYNKSLEYQSTQNGYLKVYPNPMARNNNLQIEFIDLNTKSIRLVITDYLGKVHYSTKIKGLFSGNKYTIELGNKLQDGIYLLRASTEDNRTYFKRLIVNSN